MCRPSTFVYRPRVKSPLSSQPHPTIVALMADASPSSAVALQPEGTISRLKEQDNQQLFKGLIFQGLNYL